MLHQPVSNATRQTQEEKKWKEDDEEEWTSPNLRMFYGISLEMREVDEMEW